MDLNRRNLLCGLGGLAVGGMLAARPESCQAEDSLPFSRFQQMGGDFSWTPRKLEPAESARIAYEAYWHKGYACGFGTFYGIIGVMAEKYGAPYSLFPFSMLEFLKGGIANWGTICGALGAAAAAFSLFYGRKEQNVMVTELFRWYQSTQLPQYNPGTMAKGVQGKIPSNVSESVLCHISVSKWCYANKVEATSKKRSERCGRLTADVCRKAVEILNAKIDAGKKFKGAMPKPESVAYCGDCHQKKGEAVNWGKGVLNCTPCHDGRGALSDKFLNHP